ncbi:unnamed protein product [Pseudo-nitzschia multistriata]|uniref:Prenyltransferase alpha-alpha toroid domain-containing protein n=1 Tax=Pseudo-nitzschia multistriata TaxID=183589 RepID=A0A448ZAG5_9STRA|nr:unnamed protein product [Pseudo-nitzschia multistriata]
MSHNINININNKPPPFCLFDTETTILQKRTETECKPYFVDLSALPDGDRRHLEEAGLLGTPGGGDPGRGGRRLVRLLREKHRAYLEGVWRKPLGPGFVSLDSSRPWMLYWCLQGYDLLSGEPGGSGSGSDEKANKKWITNSDGASMVSTLEDCWQGYHTAHSEIPIIVDRGDATGSDRDANTSTSSNTSTNTDASSGGADPLYFAPHEDDEHRQVGNSENESEENENKNEDEKQNEALYYCGGFGGGPGQMAHAATTYAAILALCILATSREEDDADGPSADHDGDGNDNDDDSRDSYEQLHYSKRAERILREIRVPLYRWMASLQVPETGGYRMQHDGEVDVRATYTIACCSRLLGLLPPQGSTSASTSTNALCRPLVIDYVRSCQTYEGGMGGEPFSEAHGGYTLCAVAALQLLGALGDFEPEARGEKTDPRPRHAFDVSSLLGWLSRRQKTYEGGFSGRSNKLVDGCYSYWQGGAIAIASSRSGVLGGEGGTTSGSKASEDPWLERYYREQHRSGGGSGSNTGGRAEPLPFPLLYNVFLLERYILLCAQEITGGLRDKPSKPRDFYHTCYNLCGLSIAQHCGNHHEPGEGAGTAELGEEDTPPDPQKEDFFDPGFGDEHQTLVEATHPCYNIRIDRVAAILDMEWE